MDLTIVNEKGEEKYELEIEVIDPEKYNALEFSKIIEKYLTLLNDSDYNELSFCNYHLSNGYSRNSDRIDTRNIPKPRDLLKKDVSSKNSILRNFAVSIKAHGVPVFLVFFDNEVMYITSKSEITKLCPLEKKYYALNNSIFMGELIEREGLKDKNFTDFLEVFLPFDTICYRGENTTKLNYLSRIDKTKDIVDMEILCRSVKKLKVLEKKIFPLGTESKTFYEGFEKCYNEKQKIIYYEDGYIFTPIDDNFLPEGQKNKRIKDLSKLLAICKFKKLEMRSIDLKVIDGKLYYYNKYTEDLDNFDKLKYIINGDLNNQIVEFFPLFENDNVILNSSRIRDDKEYPNEKSQVIETVDSYFEKNPITEETLRGKDTVLMRDFNNKVIKSGLIRDLEDYVIDMGAGNGGDISKYGYNKKIKKILAVEPNPEYSNNFKKRLSASPFVDKFNLLSEVKAEDTQIILEGMNFFPKNLRNSQLNIVFMISLSFFWSSEENLKQLAYTINSINKEYKNRGGNKEIKIVFYTIIGKEVVNFFKKIGKTSVKLNTITLSLSGKNQVRVDISDSKTVSKQIEYLVYLEELFELIGADLVEISKPYSIGRLISRAELNYNSLFKYGYAKINESLLPSTPIKKIEIDYRVGIEIKGKILAKGEDTIEEVVSISKDVYRIGTLDMDKSALHCISKLVQEDYLVSDVYKRIKLVDKFYDILEGNLDLENLSKFYKININVYYNSKINNINGNYDNTVNLIKFSGESFEPMVKIIGKKVIKYF